MLTRTLTQDACGLFFLFARASVTNNSNGKQYTLCYDDGREPESVSVSDEGIDDLAGAASGDSGDGINLGLVETSTLQAYLFDKAIEFDNLTFKDLASGIDFTTTSKPIYDVADSSL